MQRNSVIIVRLRERLQVVERERRLRGAFDAQPPGSRSIGMLVESDASVDARGRVIIGAGKVGLSRAVKK